MVNAKRDHKAVLGESVKSGRIVGKRGSNPWLPDSPWLGRWAIRNHSTPNFSVDFRPSYDDLLRANWRIWALATGFDDGENTSACTVGM